MMSTINTVKNIPLPQTPPKKISHRKQIKMEINECSEYIIERYLKAQYPNCPIDQIFEYIIQNKKNIKLVVNSVYYSIIEEMDDIYEEWHWCHAKVNTDHVRRYTAEYLGLDV